MRTKAEQKIIEYIGAYGLKGSRCASTSHLCEVASILFAIGKREETTPDSLAGTITSLGKRERSRRARFNMKKATMAMLNGRTGLDGEAEDEWLGLVKRVRSNLNFVNLEQRAEIRAYMQERHGVSI